MRMLCVPCAPLACGSTAFLFAFSCFTRRRLNVANRPEGSVNAMRFKSCYLVLIVSYPRGRERRYPFAYLSARPGSSCPCPQPADSAALQSVSSEHSNVAI